MIDHTGPVDQLGRHHHQHTKGAPPMGQLSDGSAILELGDGLTSAVRGLAPGPVEREAINQVERGGGRLTVEQREAVTAERRQLVSAHRLATQTPYEKRCRELREQSEAKLREHQAAYQAQEAAKADAREQARQAELDEAIAHTIAQGDRADEDAIIRAYRLAKSRKPGQL